MAQLLIEAGADVNAAGATCATFCLAPPCVPRIITCMRVCMSLCALDACVCPWLRPCVHAHVHAVGRRYGTTSLLMAAKRGHGAIVELLLSRGADAEVTGLAYGTTALIAAAQQGHLSIVRAPMSKRKALFWAAAPICVPFPIGPVRPRPGAASRPGAAWWFSPLRGPAVEADPAHV